MIPFYTWPTDGSWDKLASLAQKYPRVQVLAVINPNSGPGASRNTDYVNGIAKLIAAGITVFGYVSTGYSRRAPSSVSADIISYANWYSLKNIFFDEVPTTQTTWYNQFATGKTSIGNPGTNDTWAHAIFTYTNVYEGSGMPANSSVNGEPPKSCLIPYAVPIGSVNYAAELKLVDFLYVQDNMTSNPWNTLSGHTEPIMQVIEAQF
jgi:hypothetical protein